MARVLPLSKTFPKAKHPRAGEETFFVQGFLRSIYEYVGLNYLEVGANEVGFDISDINVLKFRSKGQTVRNGKHWKRGDIFSPRIWSDVPYKSPQIKIFKDTELHNVWDFQVSTLGTIYIDGIEYGNLFDETPDVVQLAKNDGLAYSDLVGWFNKGLPFDGQILVWDKRISYF